MLVKINGHLRHFRRIESVEKLGNGKFRVQAPQGEFVIEGGRHYGGRPRDWLLEGSGLAKAISCTSVADALNCIEAM